MQTEADETDPDPPHELDRTLDALRYLEQIVTNPKRLIAEIERESRAAL